VGEWERGQRLKFPNNRSTLKKTLFNECLPLVFRHSWHKSIAFESCATYTT
jgi:hypothetical protein